MNYECPNGCCAVHVKLGSLGVAGRRGAVPNIVTLNGEQHTYVTLAAQTRKSRACMERRVRDRECLQAETTRRAWRSNEAKKALEMQALASRFLRMPRPAA